MPAAFFLFPIIATYLMLIEVAQRCLMLRSPADLAFCSPSNSPSVYNLSGPSGSYLDRWEADLVLF